MRRIGRWRVRVCGRMIGLSRVVSVSDRGMEFVTEIVIEIVIEIMIETVIEIAIEIAVAIMIVIITTTNTTLVYNKQVTLFVPEAYSQSDDGKKRSAPLSPPPAPTSRHTHTRVLPLILLSRSYHLPSPPTAVSHCRSTAAA